MRIKRLLKSSNVEVASQEPTSWMKTNREANRSLGGAYKEDPAVAKARLEASQRIRFKKNKYER